MEQWHSHGPTQVRPLVKFMGLSSPYTLPSLAGISCLAVVYCIMANNYHSRVGGLCIQWVGATYITFLTVWISLVSVLQFI